MNDTNRKVIIDTEKYLFDKNLPFPHFLHGSSTIVLSSDEFIINSTALFDKKQLGGREHINTIHYGIARNNILRVLINEEFPKYQPLIKFTTSEAKFLQSADTELRLEGKLINIKKKKIFFYMDYEFVVKSVNFQKIIFKESGNGVLLPIEKYKSLLRSE